MIGLHDRSGVRSPRWAGNLLVVGVPILALLTVVGFGQPLFETNDDTALAMAGSGFGLAAEREAHLTFSHVAYGKFLNAISLVLGPQAHGVVTLAALALCLGLCIDACRTFLGRNPLLLASALSLGSAIFANAMLRPQFTATASILSASSIAAYIIHNTPYSKSTKNAISIRNIIIYTGIILGYTIRPASATAVFIAFLPAIVWIYTFSPKIERATYIKFVGSILAIYGVLAAIDWASYALSPTWSEVLSYNAIRSIFTDFYLIAYDPNAGAFQRAKWTHNDYLMIRNFFSDSPIFDKSVLADIAGGYSARQMLSLPAIGEWMKAPLRWPVAYCLLAAQAALVFWPARQRGALALLIVGQLCVIALVAITGRPPLFRVWFAVAAATILLQFAFIIALGQSRSRWSMQAALSLFLIGCGAFGLERIVSEHRATLRSAAEYRETVDKAGSALNGKLVAWGSSFYWEWLITPTRVYFPLTDFGVIPIGGYSRTPIASGAMRRAGISDLPKALCTDSDVRLIVDPSLISLLSTFCTEHYGTEGAFEAIASLGGPNVYRLQQTGKER